MFKDVIKNVSADLGRLEAVKKACGKQYNGKIARFLFFLKALIVNESFMVCFWFRIGCYLRHKHNVISKCLLFLVRFIHMINCRITGIQLSIGTEVGPGLYFDHYSCIVIAPTVKIGNNCTIFQGVTIGRTWNGSAPPVIGNNCVICAGAKIIGDVKLGDNVVDGANSVVTKNVPAHSVVVGIPARIISNDSSMCFSDSFKQWFNFI